LVKGKVVNRTDMLTSRALIICLVRPRDPCSLLTTLIDRTDLWKYRLNIGLTAFIVTWAISRHCDYYR
jgi:hypothetical protein